MNERSAGLLTVVGEHEEEIEADRADVNITVRGSAVLSGAMGLRTVREVAELAAELERIGVPESDIHLFAVTMDVNPRAIGKSSSATCRLRVTCRDLEQLPAIMLSITSARHASMDHITWDYTREKAVEQECLEKAFRQAAEKARRSAEALGADLGRVRRAREIDNVPTYHYPSAPMAVGQAFRADAELAIPEVPMGQTKKISARAEVVYFLAPVTSPASD